MYRRRVMDRDVEELPYGDERPSSSRRPRAADDGDDGRSSKRVKLEDSKTPREPTPQRDAAVAAAARQGTRTPQAPKDKSPSVRAGSEEGEIEED